MITKAEIQSIDFAGNTCVVRMPYFESAAGGDLAIAVATISNTPGIYNGYKVGDMVLVGFEDGEPQSPCVIGKLYLGSEEENKDPRGSINCTTLISSNANTLPLNTKIESDTNDTIEVASGTTSFKTLKELVEGVQLLNNYLGVDGNKLISDNVKVVNNSQHTKQNILTNVIDELYTKDETMSESLPGLKTYLWVSPAAVNSYANYISLPNNVITNGRYIEFRQLGYRERELQQNITSPIITIPTDYTISLYDSEILQSELVKFTAPIKLGVIGLSEYDAYNTYGYDNLNLIENKITRYITTFSLKKLLDFWSDVTYEKSTLRFKISKLSSLIHGATTTTYRILHYLTITVNNTTYHLKVEINNQWYRLTDLDSQLSKKDLWKTLIASIDESVAIGGLLTTPEEDTSFADDIIISPDIRYLPNKSTTGVKLSSNNDINNFGIASFQIAYLNLEEVTYTKTQIDEKFATKTNLTTLSNKVEQLTTYSTKEEKCGTWIDNKPIYRRVFEVSHDPVIASGNTFSFYIDLSELNFDMIWTDLSMSIQIGDTYVLNQYCMKNQEDYWNSYITKNNKQINIRGYAPDNISKHIIVVKYTKAS